MSYENFRNAVSIALLSSYTEDEVMKLLDTIDRVADGFDVVQKSTALIPVDDVPKAVFVYLASKSVEHASRGTIAQYRYRLTDFFRTIRKPLEAISANDVRLYLYQCKDRRGNSDSYLDGIRLILNGFFVWCIANDYLAQNPVSKIARIKHQPAERNPLTAYELEEIRWSCKSIREKALIDFLFSTGCRVSEASAVKLSDIDWSNRSVAIQHGKGDKRRTVFFNAESELTLRKYLETRQDDCAYLFVTVRAPHRQLSIRAIQNEIRSICSRSSVTSKCTPHVLRHTFATTGLRAGMPLERLQALMGHAKPETTMIYARLNTADLQTAHQQAFI